MKGLRIVVPIRLVSQALLSIQNFVCNSDNLVINGAQQLSSSNTSSAILVNICITLIKGGPYMDME